MGTFKDIYDVGMDWIEARMPLKIGLSIRDDPQTIYVSVTNRTRKSPVFVHAVRIHHGRSDYSYSFTLEPYEKQQVEPKDTKDFLLSPTRSIRVSHHQRVKELPKPDSAMPPFDSPADLFRAIANGNPRDSWIEVDFNEFKERRFKRGYVKSLFAGVLQRATAKRTSEQRPRSTAPTTPIAPIFDGKTGHRCSNCDFLFLMQADAASVTCPRCKHTDILKPQPQWSEMQKRETPTNQTEAKDMLPPAIKELMQEAVNNQLPVYHKSVNEAQRKLKFRMSNQGLLDSSIYRQERGKTYIAEFEKFAKNVLAEIKRIHFIPYPNCEQDLIAIATKAIDTIYQHESNLFQKLFMHDQDFHWGGYKASYERVLRETGTEIKIYVNDLRAKYHPVPPQTTQPITIVGNSNVVQSGQNQIFKQVENQKVEKPHWTVTPMFWIALFGLVAAIIVTIPVIKDWLTSKPDTKLANQEILSPEALDRISKKIHPAKEDMIIQYAPGDASWHLAKQLSSVFSAKGFHVGLDPVENETREGVCNSIVGSTSNNFSNTDCLLQLFKELNEEPHIHTNNLYNFITIDIGHL